MLMNMLFPETSVNVWDPYRDRFPKATPDPAELMDDLKHNGIETQDIDPVFLTHLHGDHLGWNLSKEGQYWTPTFPDARYLLQNADWTHFTRPEFLDNGRREAAERDHIPLDYLGVLGLIEGDYDVANGLTVIHALGHTP